MSETCPHPHTADAGGWCPLCGIELTAGPAGGDREHCASCGARLEGGRFCEECGHPAGGDPTAARPPAGWTATVAHDRERFASSGAGDDGVEFPGEAERRLVLSAPEVSIGRRSRLAPRPPDVDLGGPPGDPGVSRHHARLLWHDGGWTLIDDGSANGTYVNGATTPVPHHEPVILAEGDRIGLGLWTRITITHPGGCRVTEGR